VITRFIISWWPPLDESKVWEQLTIFQPDHEQGTFAGQSASRDWRPGSGRGGFVYVHTSILTLEGAGSLCLISGLFARQAALIMFLYLIPVTGFLHAFMSVNSQKNLGIMGGLLMIAAHGPGRFALGQRRHPTY